MELSAMFCSIIYKCKCLSWTVKISHSLVRHLVSGTWVWQKSWPCIQYTVSVQVYSCFCFVVNCLAESTVRLQFKTLFSSWYCFPCPFYNLYIIANKLCHHIFASTKYTACQQCIEYHKTGKDRQKKPKFFLDTTNGWSMAVKSGN